MMFTCTISRHLFAPRIRPYPSTYFRRNFSVTPPPQASEDPETFLANFKHTSIFRKLADKPDALRAIVDLTNIMKEQGVDIATGKKPSTVLMLRLVANGSFREASKRVVDELRKAGIEVDSQETMAELMDIHQGKPGA